MNVAKSKYTKLGAATCLGLCLQFATAKLAASPWVSPGDERTRHHLQYLSDTGVINTPLTSWPVPWGSILLELDSLSLNQLTSAQLWSYHYLKHQLQRAQRTLSSQKRIYGSNNPIPFTHFASDSREEAFASSRNTLLAGNFAVNIEAQVVRDPIDEESTRLDGSFVAGTIGNWIVGAGAIDRWWGPGWQSSLILSNNARPAPGLFLKRKEALATDTPILSWLGPWSVELFVNQLEVKRSTPKTKLAGVRFDSSPVKSLNVGISYLSLHGGENVSTQEASDSSQDSPESNSNHLQAIDLRYNLNVKRVSTAVYGQYLHNKKQDNSEASSAKMYGIEAAFDLANIHSRIALEKSDTESDILGNNIYEHQEYPDGYQYYGRILGESAGDNASKYSLLGDHYLSNGQQISWRYSSIKLSGDSNSNTRAKRKILEASFKHPLNDFTLVSFGGFALDEGIKQAEKHISSGAYLQLEFRF